MKATLSRFTTYFDTYEAREASFRKSIFSLIPRKYAGPELFWKDFGRISVDDLLKLNRNPVAYITSNPRDCLAFATPWQALSAAVSQARSRSMDLSFSLSDVTETFSIQDILYQPIRTLSGGETVKVAMAKAYITAAFSHRLSVASPFNWLSRSNTRFFKKLFEFANHRHTPVELFALRGEDSDDPIGKNDACVMETGRPVEFNFCLNKLQILLESSINPVFSKRYYAAVGHFEATLASPCMLVGENGHGKTLIAKALSGAVRFEGQADIFTGKAGGPPRLLFQNVLTQTLMRSFDAIAATLPRITEVNVNDLYNDLLNDVVKVSRQTDQPVPQPNESHPNITRSLLEIKIMLVAARLCSRPSALILDEPDWGFTRAAAVAFVSAIIKKAHSLGIPVILISHKPWWTPLAASFVKVSRSSKNQTASSRRLFEIHLHHKEKSY